MHAYDFINQTHVDLSSESEIEEFNEILKDYFGGYVALWDYCVSHSYAILSLSNKTNDKFLNLFIGSTIRIELDTDWQNKELTLKRSENPNEYCLSDEGQKIIFFYLSYRLENEPIHTIQARLQDEQKN